MTAEQRCRLLAILAHPDDESRIVGGTLAKYADAGVGVGLICATRGEAGGVGDPPVCRPEELPGVREAELRAACAILGVDHLVILGYRDRTLPQVNPTEIVGRLVAEIRRLQPEAIITFGPEGRTLHPDHIAIHRYTTQAFHRAGDRDAYPAHEHQGLAPHAPAKLYYTTFPQSVREAIGPRFPGQPDEEITVSLDVAPWLDRKRRATEAHRTQRRPPFAHLPEVRRWEILSREYYFRAASRLRTHPRHEEDIFDGLG
ncbi:MAG: PIG-L deacetylase family protein [Candidatus Methylomirabilales bacterium]